MERGFAGKETAELSASKVRGQVSTNEVGGREGGGLGDRCGVVKLQVDQRSTDRRLSVRM